jgi:polyisoprenoid-binding protein YceI
MTSTAQAPTTSTAQGAWRLDPKRSSVEFHVRHFYGLMTVKGHFDTYEGRLDLARPDAVELTIEADSLDTGHRKRDEHLRSPDFFGVKEHPYVRFVSDSAELRRETLAVSGRLSAAGGSVPVALEASLRDAGEGELEVEAHAEVDHRELGMTWSPLGIQQADRPRSPRRRLRPRSRTQALSGPTRRYR